tara:strand:+ start:679 stop:831 length:153 start_codon:yes stop_codon:yes gene_type:complete
MGNQRFFALCAAAHATKTKMNTAFRWLLTLVVRNGVAITAIGKAMSGEIV